MEEARKFASGREKGKPALTLAEHEWLLKNVGDGTVTKIGAAAHLNISLPTVNKWLAMPLGERPPSGGRRRNVGQTASAKDASDTGAARTQHLQDTPNSERGAA